MTDIVATPTTALRIRIAYLEAQNKRLSDELEGFALIIDRVEHHNRVAGQVVKQICRPFYGGDQALENVMVLLESIIAGVFICFVKPGGDRPVMDALSAAALVRIASTRCSIAALKAAEPEATA